MVAITGDCVTTKPSGEVAGGVVPAPSRTPQPRVFVMDKNKRPLQPMRPDRARKLLRRGRARVHRQAPFTIRMVDVDMRDVDVQVDGVELGIDPGSRATGIAVFDTDEQGAREGVWLGELTHRGLQIKKALQSRSILRRGRRSRNLRYRAPRFDNRTRPDGWLAPSLQHRVDTTTAWVDRLRRWAPVRAIHVERVRFDMQILGNPEMSGAIYQQGTLFGYEVREYLLEKFGRSCVYCDATGVPLNIDHVHPRSRGGSDRVTNLTLACIPCNQAKGSMPVENFVTDPVRLAKIRAWVRRPLHDAAAVNTTRWALDRALRATGLPVHASSGGRTKFNRTSHAVPKTHALDALCVGEVAGISGWVARTQTIGCTGRGGYARTRSDKYGFPRLVLTRTKRHYGFATGDMVRAVVPSGKKAGVHVGRVAVRATGSFNITTAAGPVQGIHHRHIQLTQRADGYAYHHNFTPRGDERWMDTDTKRFLPALKDRISTAPQHR